MIGKAQFFWSLGLLFIVGCNVNSSSNKFRLAEYFLEDKKYEAAIHEFEAVMEKSPKSDLGIEALFRIASIQHMYLHRPEDAAKSYHLFLKRSGDKDKLNRLSVYWQTYILRNLKTMKIL